jgi:hypothetical protein
VARAGGITQTHDQPVPPPGVFDGWCVGRSIIRVVRDPIGPSGAEPILSSLRPLLTPSIIL